MQTGLYVALSSQVALEKRLGTLADNVANAGTVGYRATSVNFRDMVNGDGPDSVSFAAPGTPSIAIHAGGLRETKTLSTSQYRAMPGSHSRRRPAPSSQGMAASPCARPANWSA